MYCLMFLDLKARLAMTSRKVNNIWLFIFSALSIDNSFLDLREYVVRVWFINLPLVSKANRDLVSICWATYRRVRVNSFFPDDFWKSILIWFFSSETGKTFLGLWVFSLISPYASSILCANSLSVNKSWIEKMRWISERLLTVSYTHLTLPTIYSV